MANVWLFKLQDDIYGAEIYGEAVPQYERPAPSKSEADVPAYEPLYSVRQARLELCNMVNMFTAPHLVYKCCSR